MTNIEKIVDKEGFMDVVFKSCDPNRKIKAFILQNPYPSFGEVRKSIFNHKPLFIEYNEICHGFCNLIYENIWDKELIKKKGEIINHYYGYRTMWICYMVLTKYSPFTSHDTNKDVDLEIYTAPMHINTLWEGIGEWKAINHY